VLVVRISCRRISRTGMAQPFVSSNRDNVTGTTLSEIPGDSATSDNG